MKGLKENLLKPVGTCKEAYCLRTHEDPNFKLNLY